MPFGFMYNFLIMVTFVLGLLVETALAINAFQDKKARQKLLQRSNMVLLLVILVFITYCAARAPEKLSAAALSAVFMPIGVLFSVGLIRNLIEAKLGKRLFSKMTAAGVVTNTLIVWYYTYLLDFHIIPLAIALVGSALVVTYLLLKKPKVLHQGLVYTWYVFSLIVTTVAILIYGDYFSLKTLISPYTFHEVFALGMLFAFLIFQDHAISYIKNYYKKQKKRFNLITHHKRSFRLLKAAITTLIIIPVLLLNHIFSLLNPASIGIFAIVITKAIGDYAPVIKNLYMRNKRS